MILRMWHGRTPTDLAESYEQFLERRAIPDYRSVSGNLGAMVLRREDGAVVHFVTISYWDSADSIRAFAGEDLLTAKYYPEDEQFFLEKEEHVLHFEVVSAAGIATSHADIPRLGKVGSANAKAGGVEPAET